jgi:hypothetical protein
LILVEAMGHNNYGTDQDLDIKGLIYCAITILLEDPIEVQITWNFYKLNINE